MIDLNFYYFLCLLSIGNCQSLHFSSYVTAMGLDVEQFIGMVWEIVGDSHMSVK